LTDDIKVMELDKKSDLLGLETECPNPHCGSKYMRGVPFAEVTCKKCGTNYKTVFKQTMYAKKATQILSALSFHDGLVLRMPGAYEADIIHVQKLFQLQGCWDVTEISSSTETFRYCDHCGMCMNCYTCKKCGTAFTKDPNRRKIRCSKCKETSFVKTHFEEVNCPGGNRAIRLCPFCQTDKVRMTITKNKEKCHACGKKGLHAETNRTMYEVTIKRKKAYKKENL